MPVPPLALSTGAYVVWSVGPPDGSGSSSHWKRRLLTADGDETTTLALYWLPAVSEMACPANCGEPPACGKSDTPGLPMEGARAAG